MEQWSASIPSIAPTAIQDLPAVVIYRIVGHSPNITGSSEGTHHPPATCVLSHWVHHTESAYLPRVKKTLLFASFSSVCEHELLLKEFTYYDTNYDMMVANLKHQEKNSAAMIQ